MHTINNGTAYFAKAVSYTHQMFMKLTSGGYWVIYKGDSDNKKLWLAGANLILLLFFITDGLVK